MSRTEHDLSVVRVCKERCETCIFSPRSPLATVERRRHYERIWRRKDTFQNCHHGTVIGDTSLMCRGFYDWSHAVGWQPTILQLGERLDRIRFVPLPTEDV